MFAECSLEVPQAIRHHKGDRREHPWRITAQQDGASHMRNERVHEKYGVERNERVYGEAPRSRRTRKRHPPCAEKRDQRESHIQSLGIDRQWDDPEALQEFWETRLKPRWRSQGFLGVVRSNYYDAQPTAPRKAHRRNDWSVHHSCGVEVPNACSYDRGSLGRVAFRVVKDGSSAHGSAVGPGHLRTARWSANPRARGGDAALSVECPPQ